MNDVETRLRDALAARGAAVTGEPDAYAAITRRRARRRVTRAVPAVVGVAAAAAVAMLATGIVPRPGRPTGPAGPAAPPAAVALVADGTLYLARPDLTGRVSVLGKSLRVTSVAALGDGRTFYAAALQTSNPAVCRSTVFRVTATDRPTGLEWTTDPVPGLDPVDTYVTDLAVTRDGTRLAYLQRWRLRDTTRCGNDGEIRVRDLASGREQAFPDGSVGLGGPPFLVSSMGFSPDGRFLALGYDYAVLDTNRPGGFAEHVENERAQVGDVFCRVAERTYLPGGELAESLDCPPESAEPDGVYVVAPGTRVAQRLVFASPGAPGEYVRQLDFDASGDHALFELARREGRPRLVYRWTQGQPPRRVDAPGGVFLTFAW